MRTKRKPWALFTMACLLLGILVCAGATYIIDPFEQYRESSILPLYDQESYNNPGIAKNYDYNAVILGTSMVEMSNPSVIDRCFGVKSVKLPMRGSHTAQMGWQLEHVFHAKEQRGETRPLLHDQRARQRAGDDQNQQQHAKLHGAKKCNYLFQMEFPFIFK